MSRTANFEQGLNIEVLDGTQRDNIPTGRVILGNVGGYEDSDLAKAAGYSSQHFGYRVQRHDNDRATVHLYND